MDGEFFGSTLDFEYNIGDKLYDFAIMEYDEIEENHYVLQTIMYEWTTEIDKISKKKHNEYIKFFETIKDYLIKDLINQKSDLKERLELISEYSNNSFSLSNASFNASNISAFVFFNVISSFFTTFTPFSFIFLFYHKNKVIYIIYANHLVF